MPQAGDPALPFGGQGRQRQGCAAPQVGGLHASAVQGMAGEIQGLPRRPHLRPQRLQALGMIEGTEISVLNNKNEGTVIIKMRSTRLALGKGISSHIGIRGKDHD